MLQNTRPRFLLSTTGVHSEDLIASNSPFAILSSFDLGDFSHMNIAIALFHVRQEITNLTDLQSRLMSCPSYTSAAEAMEFAASRTTIEHILLLAGQGFAVTHGPDQDGRLREMCCIAGSIYVNYVLRGFQPRPNVVLKTLKRRLMTCVEQFELEDYAKSDPVSASIAVFFWALCVGATMSLDTAERNWFVLRTSRAAKHLGLGSWEQVSSLLDCFLWSEKLENEAWKSIWTDLQESIVTT